MFVIKTEADYSCALGRCIVQPKKHRLVWVMSGTDEGHAPFSFEMFPSR
jgi:hypothetical protein